MSVIFSISSIPWYVYFVKYAFKRLIRVAIKNPSMLRSQNMYVSTMLTQNVIQRLQDQGLRNTTLCILPFVINSAILFTISCGALNISQISTTIKFINISVFTIFYNIIHFIGYFLYYVGCSGLLNV